MLVFTSVRRPIIWLICTIRIGKSIVYSHIKRIEVECLPRDRMHGVELSRLVFNIIVGFIELSNAIVV